MEWLALDAHILQHIEINLFYLQVYVQKNAKMEENVCRKTNVNAQRDIMVYDVNIVSSFKVRAIILSIS